MRNPLVLFMPMNGGFHPPYIYNFNCRKPVGRLEERKPTGERNTYCVGFRFALSDYGYGSRKPRAMPQGMRVVGANNYSPLRVHEPGNGCPPRLMGKIQKHIVPDSLRLIRPTSFNSAACRHGACRLLFCVLYLAHVQPNQTQRAAL